MLSKITAALLGRIWSFTRPKIRQLYYTGGGLGDELMFTAIAAEARKRGSALHVLTDRPEVWEGNTDAASVQTGVGKWFDAKNRGLIKTEITHLSCQNGVHVHLAAQMAGLVGLELTANWAPVYRPRSAARVEPGTVVIQNSCRGALYAAVTKEWPFERWGLLVERLIAEGHQVVQIGTRHDPPLPEVVDLRGNTDLPRAASILEQAKLFIGLESGLMHLAAAVRVPSVIIYGGRTRPHETGYPFHFHAGVSQLPCSGCGLNSDCPIEVKCMTDVSVEEVWNAVQEAVEPRVVASGNRREACGRRLD